MRALTKILAGTIFLIVFTGVFAAIGGWWIMTAAGLMHTEWVHEFPPVG